MKEDAPVRLGVGKNMVRSIRYWCSAFKVLENDTPSDFGKKLLADGGWDEFLEDPASLWLLHPGLAFKLNESAICGAIEQVERSSNNLKLSDSAGLI